jgi:hypothetical protein
MTTVSVMRTDAPDDAKCPPGRPRSGTGRPGGTL